MREDARNKADLKTSTRNSVNSADFHSPSHLMSLTSVALVEKDSHGDLLVSWCYPAIPNGVASAIMTRLNADIHIEFLFFRHVASNSWVYLISQVNENKIDLPRISSFTIALTSKQYDPEKHRAFAQLLSRAYAATGDPLKLMEGFLSVFAKGSFEATVDNNILGRYVESEFDSRRALLVGSFRSLVASLGSDAVTLWTAMLLKKRIVVYGSDISTVLDSVRTMPLLVWHRQNWSILRPFCTTHADDIAECTGIFVAGFCDASIKSREDVFDVLVDLDSRVIYVCDHAKAALAPCDLHKAVSKCFADMSSSGDNQELVKQLAVITKYMVGKVMDVSETRDDGRKILCREKIDDAPTSTVNFLCSVALAENVEVV